MKKEIPNLLTLGNLLAGCIGLWFVMQGDLESASYCIFISLVCDFFDGFLARALQAYSDLGKELDSLADMVSFGVLPAFYSVFISRTKLRDTMHRGAIRILQALYGLCFSIDVRVSFSQIQHRYPPKRPVHRCSNSRQWSINRVLTSDFTFPA
jgi:CDP-diacylglycerol--serine O-phosphatidyltransferase